MGWVRIGRLAAAFVVVVVASGAVAPPRAVAAGPMADAMWSIWPDLNTKSASDKAKSNLAGYAGYNAYSTNPSSAAVAMGSTYAQSDAIWMMVGHGAAGYITTYNSSNATTAIYVSGQVPTSVCTGKNACLSSATFATMHDIRLMAFVGCHTGSTIASGDSLPKRAYYNLGVDSSLGFSNYIYGFPIDGSTGQGVMWTDRFTYYMSAAAFGYTVSDAAWKAANDVMAYSGGYGGFDSLVIYGGTVRIRPAAYGS